MNKTPTLDLNESLDSGDKTPSLRLGRDAAKAEEKRPSLPRFDTDPIDDPAKPGRTIQGKPASDIEFGTYAVLRSLGWEEGDVRFQVGLLGYRPMTPGGQLVDFVVDTGARAVVIDVRGERWHGTPDNPDPEDKFKEIRLAAMNPAPRLVIVWEEIAHNRRRLRSHLLRELGAK